MSTMTPFCGQAQRTAWLLLSLAIVSSVQATSSAGVQQQPHRDDSTDENDTDSSARASTHVATESIVVPPSSETMATLLQRHDMHFDFREFYVLHCAARMC